MYFIQRQEREIIGKKKATKVKKVITRILHAIISDDYLEIVKIHPNFILPIEQ